ncbi:MAG: protein translocase subunit SecF, partial [Cyanobacteria bacterium P01_F01_bin.153]
MFKLQVTKRSKLWWSISAGLLIAGFVAMGICFSQFGAPLRLGLDFLGGTRLQLELACGDGNSQSEACSKPIDINVVRGVLGDRELDGSSVQLLDRDSQAQDRHIIAIRSQDLSAEERSQLVSALEEQVGTFDPAATQIDTVGPVL